MSNGSANGRAGPRPIVQGQYLRGVGAARALQPGSLGVLVVPGPARQRVILALRDEAGEVGALLLTPDDANSLARELRQAVAELLTPSSAEYAAQGLTVIHRRTCEHLRSLAGNRYFDSREDALQARLRPCKACRP